jgi:hypothetical protein
MLRTTAVVAFVLYSTLALAQSYSGSFVAKNNQGNPVTLAIKQDAAGKVMGSLTGNGANFKVEATVNAEGMYGTVKSETGLLLIAAQLEGANSLKVVLAEPLPNGQPNMENARRLVMNRAGGAKVQAAAPPAKVTQAQAGNPMSPAPARGLNGAWSANVNGQPLVVEFSGTGTGKVNGEPMRWQVLGNLLFVDRQGQVTTYQHQLQGDKLSVAGGDLDGVVVLTRGTGAADAARAAQAAGGGKASGGGGGASGGNGQELVGKWCKGSSFTANSGGGSSRMTCIELRPDGSYTYHSEGSMSAQAPGMWGGTASQSGDAGRWRYDGGRLVAVSQRGQTSSYALEKRNHPKNRNDPMICLDGDCYTTAWRKNPW